VETNAPWSVTDTGSTIKIAAASITFNYTSCSRGGSGELVATPDKTSAISSTVLSGTLSGRAWSGSLSWTPAGVYGL
jgi:hypothetical protein